MSNLVAPRKCTRCSGTGFVSAYSYREMGRCFSCDGAGEVESDKAAIAARKARGEARKALGQAALEAGHEAHSGLSLLQVNDPARMAKAVDSFAAGREDVVPALVSYYRSL